MISILTPMTSKLTPLALKMALITVETVKASEK